MCIRDRPTFVCSFPASQPPPSFFGCLLPFLDASDPRAPASSLTARSVCDAPDDAQTTTTRQPPPSSHLHPTCILFPRPRCFLRPGSAVCLHPFLDASIHIWMPSALDPDSPSPPSLFGCFTSFALPDDATYLCAHLLSCSLRSSDHLPYRVTFHIGSPSLTPILGFWPTQS